MKDVPANATVVGVPGHVVVRGSGEGDEQRAAIAKKIGFDAYAERKNMPDPVQSVLDSVLDHIHKLESEISQLRKESKPPEE